MCTSPISIWNRLKRRFCWLTLNWYNLISVRPTETQWETNESSIWYIYFFSITSLMSISIYRQWKHYCQINCFVRNLTTTSRENMSVRKRKSVLCNTNTRHLIFGFCLQTSSKVIMCPYTSVWRSCFTTCPCERTENTQSLWPFSHKETSFASRETKRSTNTTDRFLDTFFF